MRFSEKAKPYGASVARRKAICVDSSVDLPVHHAWQQRPLVQTAQTTTSKGVDLGRIKDGTWEMAAPAISGKDEHSFHS